VLCRAFSIFRIVRAGVIATLALTVTALQAAAWERPHGDGANLNFENVATSPAVSASRSVSGLGTIALGAGPVIAADGTVYLANKEGEVIALHADGTPYWRRTISSRQVIVASPAIGADGTIYVIGTSHATDHRVDPPVLRHNSSLHRFTASGGYLGATPFPQHDLGGAAIAPPNIWRFQGKEMVVAPATYQRKLISTYDVRLIGFDSSGSVVADQIVSSVVPELFGGDGQPAWANVVCGLTLIGCLLGKEFERFGELPSAADGAGIFTFAGGGTPFVVISDGVHDVAGYTFSGGAFVESFRVHDTGRFMRSAPATLPDGHTVIGVERVETNNNGAPVGSGEGGAVFTGPNFNKVAPVGGTSALYATPTRLADGRVLLLGYSGDLTVLRNNAVADRLSMPGRSMVSPAASQSHVFISMSGAFITLDANSLAEVARVDWPAGGTSQPAIGPKGHVYAVDGNVLHIFAPGRQLPPNRILPDSAPTAVSTSGADTKPYKPPLTPSGNRLFACEELDGDDCGKGDYQAIATAFCKKEGFIGAGQIQVDRKNVKAETLDGRYCSKKKCKVFEQIVCANN
jgi:outer membrane protein assembly factor BamB